MPKISQIQVILIVIYLIHDTYISYMISFHFMLIWHVKPLYLYLFTSQHWHVPVSDWPRPLPSQLSVPSAVLSRQRETGAGSATTAYEIIWFCLLLLSMKVTE